MKTHRPNLPQKKKKKKHIVQKYNDDKMQNINMGYMKALAV